MKLTELEPSLLKVAMEDGTPTMVQCESLSNADGVVFLCPACFVKNNGSVGTHCIICWKPHVPQSITPGPGRWNFEGTDLSDITLYASSSSISIGLPCNAHFFIRAGKVIAC